jgi:integrase
MSYQNGYLYKTENSWHLRFYQTLPSGRKQTSRRVCDGKFTRSAAKKLAQPMLAEINETVQIVHQHKTGTPYDQTIVDFWERSYFPWAERTLKPYTIGSYSRVWKQHLLPHFGTITLRTYRTKFAMDFLEKLAREGYGRNTIAHIRSLMSGIFTRAAADELCSSNPIRACKVRESVAEPEETAHYTPAEAQKILVALEDRLDAQVVFALGFYCGLRPGEINALTFSDVRDGWVHIERAVSNGIVGKPKSKAGYRTIPLIEPVKSLLERLRAKLGNRDGYCFPDGPLRPINLMHFAERVIARRVTKAGLPWYGLYAARRGFATVLGETCADGGIALMHLMGHTKLDVTLVHYVKPVPKNLAGAMRAMEAAITAK